MDKWSKRLKWAIRTAVPFVLDRLLGAAFGLNFENLLTKIGAADLLVEGPPASWRAAMSAIFQDWLAPAAGYIFGDFGLGFVIAAVLFSIPDIKAAISRMNAHLLAKQAEYALEKNQERTAAERDTIEMLRSFMLSYVQALRDDLDTVNKITLKEIGDNYSSLNQLLKLAYSSIIEAEEQKFHRFAKHFAYDKHDAALSTLQSVLCNYLIEYEKLVRASHELIRSSANHISSSDAYRKWKNNDTQCLLRFRKLAENHLLSDLALFLHLRNFRMGQEYYIP